MLEWLNSGHNGPAPKVYVANFLELLKRARKPNSAGDRSNGRVSISDGELAWLKRLHEDVRNQFLHFQPMNWSLEVSGLPQLGILVSSAIGEIAQIGWAFRHKDEQWLAELQGSLAELGKTL